MVAWLFLIALAVLAALVAVTAMVVFIVVAVGVSRATASTDAPLAFSRPVSLIEQAAEGAEVTIAGHARGLGEPAREPLSGEPVLAFRAVLEVLKSRRSSDVARWRVVHVEQQLADFLVVDGSGEARVGGERATLEALAPETESFGGLKGPSAAARAFMERAAYELPRSLTMKIHRLKVHRLVEGAPVQVAGRARWSDSPASTSALRQASRRLLIEAGEAPVRVESIPG